VKYIRSLAETKYRNIFFVFFSLASLIPLLFAIFMVCQYVFPLFTTAEWEGLINIFAFGLLIMFLLPALSFLLMYRWVKSLENLTTEVVLKSKEIAEGRKESAEQKIGKKGEVAVAKEEEIFREENEIQSLVRCFNNIFETHADQLAERTRLKELLANLIAVASDLTSELEFDRLFPLIIGNVTEAMSAERTSLYVIDWEQREIWTKVSEGIKQIRVPLGHGISGRVAESGMIINVADAWDLPYFDRSYDEMNRFRTRSVLCMPIKSRFGGNVGVLQVINKRGKDRFDEEDEIFLRGLTSQVGIALENSLLLDEIMLSFTSAISTFSAMVDAKHPFTAGHSDRVTEYSILIAKEMKLSNEEIEELKYAAILHDIGKIGIRDDILMKNGAFTNEERAEMQTHTVKTKTILENFRFPQPLQNVPEIACHHHEKVDGQGYPDGRTGDTLHIGSKIMAVADVFDALTSRRDYPKYAFGEVLTCEQIPLDKVVEILKADTGSHFDKDVVDAFLRCLGDALLLYRGSHFSPEYVDHILRVFKPVLRTDRANNKV